MRGVDRVWAAADCTDVSIKQGGVSAALADVAADSIAATPASESVFAPVARGAEPPKIRATYLGSHVLQGRDPVLVSQA